MGRAVIKWVCGWFDLMKFNWPPLHVIKSANLKAMSFISLGTISSSTVLTNDSKDSQYSHYTQPCVDFEGSSWTAQMSLNIHMRMRSLCCTLGLVRNTQRLTSIPLEVPGFQSIVVTLHEHQLSQILYNLPVCSTSCSGHQQRTIKAHYWPFVRGILQIPLTKGQ